MPQNSQSSVWQDISNSFDINTIRLLARALDSVAAVTPCDDKSILRQNAPDFANLDRTSPPSFPRDTPRPVQAIHLGRPSVMGARAGRVAGCHRRHGRQLNVEWGGTCPADLGQQATYCHFRSDSGEDRPATREPCWSRENRLCVRIAWRGRGGMPASVWRSRSRLGFEPAVAWERHPTGSPATAIPGPVSTLAPCMRNELLLGLGESACGLGKAD